MKKIILSILIVTFGFSGGVFSQPGVKTSTRNTTWRGVWVSAAGTKGKIEWTVTETTQSGMIFAVEIIGTSTDKYGKASISGGCGGDGRCQFSQTYSSGSFKGKSYEYEASDFRKNNSNRLTYISGEYRSANGKKAGSFTISSF